MKYLPPLFILLLFAAILFNPALCIQAASEGLKLWYNQVLPALFPSMILTSFIIRSNLLTYVISGNRLLNHLPITYILPLASGILCGYPIGAKTCRDLYDTGELTAIDVKRMNCFVHTPSPMFMLGYVSTISLPSIKPFKLFLSIYLPIIVLLPLSILIIPITTKSPTTVTSSHKLKQLTFSMDLFDEVYNKSVQILIKIAGYLMLFTIVNQLILHLFPHATAVLVPLSGILEMTYGVRFVSIQQILCPTKELLAVFFLGFGGLSTMLQVRDALPKGQFYPIPYLSFRFLHGILAAFIYFALQFF